MGATNLKQTLFRNAHDKIKSAEKALVDLQKIVLPTPGIKVTITKYKLQITKMKMHLANLETIFLKQRARAIEPSLRVLKESVSDPSYVGSARSEEAYRTADKWLNSYEASSTDSLYKQVQGAVVEYAKIKKG